MSIKVISVINVIRGDCLALGLEIHRFVGRK